MYSLNVWQFIRLGGNLQHNTFNFKLYKPDTEFSLKKLRILYVGIVSFLYGIKKNLD
jgi:hypothetical protein